MPRFKLLRGIHSEGDRTYHPGDVIDSASDLSKHNRENSTRFELLPGGATGVADGLESMTVAQLRQHAEAEEIDLGDATKRAEILALCRGEVSPA
ncbi:MAG: hypothetical protein ACYTEW_21470 [Planctomycetota bacterium]|jgi:hypothetical protein